MIPEDTVVQVEKKLTSALKGNFAIAMDESGIYKLKKSDAIFNTTAKKFRKQKENQIPHTSHKIPTPAPKVQEKPARSPRVISETAPAPTLNKNTTIGEKSAKKPQSPN